jgi:hypothetical protein
MKSATLGLIVTLLASVAAHAQNQLPPEEFGLTAFVLTLGIPTSVSNPDGTPMRSGPQLWAAIKNRTSIPYSLCTSATGMSTSGSEGRGGGGLSGVDHCHSYWVLLPGETRTESLFTSFPNEPDTGLSVTIILEGKPAGSMGEVTTWTLRWRGTVGEATALGRQMSASTP